jgi:hypothetical protein
MTTERIEKTAQRALLHNHPAMKWQFIRTAAGHWRAQEWLDVNALSVGERIDYEANEPPPDMFVDMPTEPVPLWPSLAFAERWAALCDAGANIDEDLHAYGAPSECYRDAYAAHERKVNAMLTQAVQHAAAEVQP